MSLYVSQNSAQIDSRPAFDMTNLSTSCGSYLTSSSLLLYIQDFRYMALHKHGVRSGLL